MLKFIILCGGSGTRLWPLSNNKCPKQFISLFGSKTLLQHTYDRLIKITQEVQQDSEILVITNEKFSNIVDQQLPNVRQIIEPFSRDTAPAICCATLMCTTEDILLICPADHYIPDDDKFSEDILNGIEAVKQNYLVTFGLKPRYPETGYGYIEVNPTENKKWVPVKRFTEKPNLEKAKIFMKSGNFYWNSGIFLFSASLFLDEFSKYAPVIYDICLQSVISIKNSHNKILLSNFFEYAPKLSIDYALMEKSDRVAVVKCDFNWNDIGSWKSVHDISDKDKDCNVSSISENRFIDSCHNYIFNTKPITLVGLTNIAVIETDKDILILDLDQSQKVKDIAK